jgi:hypothetical protein
VSKARRRRPGIGTIGDCHKAAAGKRRRPDTTQAMSTYWYASGPYVLLCLSPQHPAPGRFLGRAELTRSELELVKHIVELDPIPSSPTVH